MYHTPVHKLPNQLRNERQAAIEIAAPRLTPNAVSDYEVLDGTAGEIDEFEYYQALQRQINAGSIWHMQGSMGRAAMDAIESGNCVLGVERFRDYWGNLIPARTDVKNGTKGSRLFVKRARGEGWARAMTQL